MHKVAVCQMNCGPDPDVNLQSGCSLVERAAANGAQAVFLPECFDYVATSKREAAALAHTLDGPIVPQYSQLCSRLGVWLSLGGMHERMETSESKVHNTHVLLSPSGHIAAVYRKVHLFDVDLPEQNTSICESDFTQPGDRLLAPVDTPFGRVGLNTCYDVRFAEPALWQRANGAQVLLYPSAFTHATGAAGHWRTLLAARAIETQCYVLAAAQCGWHGAKRRSWGHALVVDPNGAVVADCGDQLEAIGYADIDLELVQRVRQRLPCQQHRRHDLYHVGTSQTEPQPLYLNKSGTFKFGQLALPWAQAFYRTQSSVAFVNIKPVLIGHVLVAPLRVVADMQHLSSAETCDLFAVVQRVVAFLKGHFGTDSCTIAMQDGPLAGRTVPHVHVHVLPRRAGDFENNDDVYSHLAKDDSSRVDRTNAEMADEATEFRKYFYPN